ncbi:MAG: type II toxin-antitoxin system VapC family toxin [Euryarchaeota archaeon]|nr:type II toxin-antitoxin system VapC family toxin [Euryarchaeota archaeon]MDE1837407.1 type II toxin-antitoxin system VapC family toxin [Euryarchaeota archaeon]MDE1879910.1 type II toxin-antitoxin system VapC family toxin [Euryarchaeota archaeon]MDE2045493.1 type II toxin-antitoxin system VapC family toxin [Thermoplasmata archaeon]
MIVIDASALSGYLLREEGWETTAQVLREDWCTLELALTESGNAILTALRQARITESLAGQKIDSLLEMTEAGIDLQPQRALLGPALRLARTHRATVYDMLYVELAKHLTAPLLSFDRGQRRVAEGVGVAILPRVLR